jgi:hypothetical protein
VVTLSERQGRARELESKDEANERKSRDLRWAVSKKDCSVLELSIEMRSLKRRCMYGMYRRRLERSAEASHDVS